MPHAVIPVRELGENVSVPSRTEPDRPGGHGWIGHCLYGSVMTSREPTLSPRLVQRYCRWVAQSG